MWTEKWLGWTGKHNTADTGSLTGKKGMCFATSTTISSYLYIYNVYLFNFTIFIVKQSDNLESCVAAKSSVLWRCIKHFQRALTLNAAPEKKEKCSV